MTSSGVILPEKLGIMLHQFLEMFQDVGLGQYSCAAVQLMYVFLVQFG